MTGEERRWKEGKNEFSSQRYFHCQFGGLKFTLNGTLAGGEQLYEE